jgi:hypothetical protein
MKKLKKIEDVVENILDRREDAREDDDILYLCVCEHFHADVSSMTVRDFFETRKKTSCPSFASVVRSRRKVFERRPELKPEDITKLREGMTGVYIDYAING